MPDLLLVPDRIIDGPTRVTMTVRPERVAFLVHPTNPAIALAAIESACLTWGGVHQFLVPCAPGGRPDPIWAAILEKHDPAIILDLVGVDEDFQAEQQGKPTRRVERWERPTETMEITGAVVYAALRRWKRTRSTGKSRVAINLHPLTGQPFALPLAFRLGHLDPRPMDTNVIIERSYRSGRISDFIDLREVDPRRLGEDELRRLVLEVPLDISPLVAPGIAAGITNFHRLPQLTKIELPSREPTYWMAEAAHPEHEQHREEFYRRVVVVGASESVEDLCLAWNLRAQRSVAQFFPQWIRPEWMLEHDALQSMHWGLQWEPFGLSEDRDQASLHLVSATLSLDDLRAVSPDFGVPVEVHDRSLLDRFFTPGFRVGLDQTSTANFVHGTADVAIPDYAELGDWQFWERIGWTGEVAGYGPPRMDRRFIPWNGPTPVRLASDGHAGFINVPDVGPGELWLFPTSSGWNIVAAVAEEAGYTASISEKGRRALAVMQLLDGEFGLRLLASSRVFGLLERMAETVERQAVQRAVRRGLERLDMESLPQPQEEAFTETLWRDVTSGAQFDRQHFTWDQIKTTLGDDVTRDQCNQLLEWHVERRILFQGYKFMCSNCGISRWYSINHLSDKQVCEGCGFTSAKPISPNQLAWRYRLNETIAQAVDQGVLPHLLAVNRMIGWRDDRRAPLFGLLPGVQLSPLEAGGLQEIEVDLFAIKGGRIIIGECKRGGDRITDTTVDRFASVGQRLNCSRIVYATASTFDEDTAALERANEISKPAVIERWDQTALFDCFTRGGPVEPIQYLARALGSA